MQRAPVIHRRPVIHLLLPIFLVASISAADRQHVSAQQSLPSEQLLQAEQIFDPDHLVEVSIELKDEHWQKLCGQSRGPVNALGQTVPTKPFTYFPADVTVDGKSIGNVGVRKKGFFGSLDSSRPSLKIKFDEYVDQTPCVGFDRLTLNNNKSDPSQLSQYLSYKIFNESGTAAPRCNFARVTVNGKYLGIYSNVESIKPPFLNDRFGVDSGALFEGSIADFFPDSVERFEKKNKQAKFKYIRQLAEVMDRDEFTLEQLGELLDIPAFVKYWATESLIGFFDGYTNNQNNFFVYRHPDTKKFLFIPWGTDTVFWDSVPIKDFKAEVKSVHSKSILASRLYYRPDIQQLYFKTIHELLADHWDEEVLIAEIDKRAEMLREHVPDENRQFERSLTKLKAFVRSRRATVEKDLESGVAKITRGARRPMAFKITGTALGSFSTEWFDASPKNPAKTGKAHLEVVLNGQPVEFSALGVTAEPNKDKRNREAEGRMPPSVVFHGVRKSDNQQWMLPLATSSEAFRPSTQPVAVNGVVIVGNPLWFLAKLMTGMEKTSNLTLAGGTATFDQAKREAGAPVSGSVELEFGSLEGGDHLPLR